jgi:Family of unknown function (DUF6350)
LGFVTGSVLRTRPAPRLRLAPPGGGRALAVLGAVAASAVAGIGLVVLVLLVVIGWIAAPHAGLGLTGVLRTAATCWLIGNHVGFVLAGTGRIGLLPLGLVLLPGALLWRAGRWVVRASGARRLRQVAAVALAVAVPYAILAVALAVAGRSARAAPSVPQAAVGCFLLALAAAGLGGARALAPWAQLACLLPARARSVIVGMTGALAIMAAAGAALAGASLAVHLGRFGSMNGTLGAGTVGAGLLLLAQAGYVPNAIIWAISFTLGPGFAFGTGTVVAPAGSALGPLPAFPMLAALPAGPHPAVPAVLSAAMLATPYVAGALAGLLVARSVPARSLETSALGGFGCGVLTGAVLAVLAGFAGGPLGDGRLAAVGPSPWQVGIVAALEIGVAAAVTAGVVSWLHHRPGALTAAGDPRPAAGGRPADDSAAAAAAGAPSPGPGDVPRPATGDHLAHQGAASAPEDSGHFIYLNRWADDPPVAATPPARRGPASLP